MRVLLLAPLALLAACNEAEAPAPQAPTTAATAPSPTPTAAVLGPLPSAAERDPLVVLTWWARAMVERDWTSARRVWGDFGAMSGMSAQDFAMRWERYRTLDVEIGASQQEGAAGSSFFEAPVTITGETQDGASYALEGVVTMRRVNDVPGATPEQLRWHIERSTLQP